MNTDQSTPIIADQTVDELAIQTEAEPTLQAKSVWHRPSLGHIDITRTMFDPASL